MVKKFRKKPVVVEAIQLTQYSIQECYDFINPAKGNFPEVGRGIDPADGKFKITTLEGVMIADVGDWIIKGVNGEFYPCKPEIFEKTYEPVTTATATATALAETPEKAGWNINM
jgi:hypothetical protein